MYRRYPGSIRLVVITLLIAAAWLLPGSAAAQDDTGTQLTVGALRCIDAGCIDHTDLVPEFTISALDTASGDVLASCATDAADPHLCTLSLPAGADWILAWDESEVPDGYEWRGDLYPVADGPLGSATLIPFVPVLTPETPPASTPIVIEEPGHVTVQAGLCTDASCHEISEFLDLFVISAVDSDTGEVFSSCATGNAQQGLEHQCILDVPHDGTFALTWQDDQVPAGYEPFGDPFPVGDPAVLTLGFIPEVAPAPVETPTIAPTAATVTALPVTGAGPDEGPAIPWEPALLTLSTLLIAAITLAIRARHTAPARNRR